MIYHSNQSKFNYLGKNHDATASKATNCKPMPHQCMEIESFYCKLQDQISMKNYSTCYLTIDYDNSEKQQQK